MTAKKTKPETPKSRNYQAGLQRKHELEMERIKQRAETQRQALRFVMEDFRSQLLIVALTSSAAGKTLSAYEDYLADWTPDPQVPEDQDEQRAKTFWEWFGLVTETAGGAIKIAIFGEDQKPTMATAKDPYQLIGSMAAGANDIAGLAWAALFASIVMGDKGVSGLVDKGVAALKGLVG